MLKYKADLRTLGYFFVTTCLFALQWHYGFNWIVYIVYLHFAISVAVITHNHNHVNIWNNKWLNRVTDWWLSIFYGLPIFVWIPTHNRNHHRYTNKLPDISRTYRHNEDNDFVSLMQYPSKNGYHHIKESILPYMNELKTKNPEQYRQNLMQLGALLLWMVVFFVWSWKKALLYVFIPQQVSQFVVVVFNYVQHVHADEESEFNHSRNFMGVNLFLFNNGYHTVHHHRASIHWSELPAEHKKIEHLISPELIKGSLWVYLVKTYVLGAFIKDYRSNSMRKERMEKMKTEKRNDIQHTAVPVAEEANSAW